MDAAEIVARLRPELAGALIATDFDGTLAPIVPDPESSRPAAGTVAALVALAAAGARVAVITGRDALTVLRLSGLQDVPGLVVAGLYGLETWRQGELDTPPVPAQIELLRAQLPAALAGGDPVLWVEDKRLSLVVHARRAADPERALDTVRGPVTALAARLGLEPHPGNGVLELRVPGHDKAGALSRLAAGYRAALFLGDDLGDIPAFAEIRRLRAAGLTAYGVAVAATAPPAALAAADAQVPDPAAAVALLTALTATPAPSDQPG